MGLFVFGEQVYLIKDKDRAHAIGFTGRQKTIDEGGTGDRMVNRDDQCHLVNIRRENMTLFAEIGRTTDDVVTPFFNLRDPVGSIGQGLYFHKVPDRHRIGTTDTTNAEVAFYMAIRIRTIVQTNDVTATRVFNNETSHPFIHSPIHPFTVTRS